MKRVFEDDLGDFQFTVGQKMKLRLHLRGARNNRQKEEMHDEFLKKTRWCVYFWLESLHAELKYDAKTDLYFLSKFHLPPRKKEFGPPMKRLIQSIEDLKQCIQGIPFDVKNYLDAYALYNLHMNSSDFLRDIVLKYQSFRDVPSIPSDTPIPLLIDLLALIDQSAREVEEENRDRGGSHSPILKLLVTLLEEKYLRIYNKRVGYSPNTVFVKYITEIAEIFSLKVSAELIKGVIQKGMALHDNNPKVTP